MDFTPIKELDDFSFDGLSVKIEKLKNLNTVCEFRDTTLPIVLANFKPLEIIFAAILNEFAPLENLGLINSEIASEKEAYKCFVPAFRIMIQYYIPNRKYTDDHLATLIYDSEQLYEIIYSQMRKERIMEFYLRRKLTLIQDITKFANLKIDMTSIVSRAEEIINSKPKREADEEFRGTGLVSSAK